MRAAIEDEDAATMARILNARDAEGADERERRIARVLAQSQAATAASLAALAEGADERAAEVEQLLDELGAGLDSTP